MAPGGPDASGVADVAERLNANLKKLQLARSELEQQCAARNRFNVRMHEGTIERLRRRLETLKDVDGNEGCTRRNAKLLVRSIILLSCAQRWLCCFPVSSAGHRKTIQSFSLARSNFAARVRAKMSY